MSGRFTSGYEGMYVGNKSRTGKASKPTVKSSIYTSSTAEMVLKMAKDTNFNQTQMRELAAKIGVEDPKKSRRAAPSKMSATRSRAAAVEVPRVGTKKYSSGPAMPRPGRKPLAAIQRDYHAIEEEHAAYARSMRAPMATRSIAPSAKATLQDAYLEKGKAPAKPKKPAPLPARRRADAAREGRDTNPGYKAVAVTKTDGLSDKVRRGMIEEITGEIEERQEFLSMMREMGEGDKHEATIKGEIAQRLKELKRLQGLG